MGSEAGKNYKDFEIDVDAAESSKSLPKVLDPAMTMGLVSSYLKDERQRGRKALLMLSLVFSLVMILVLILFVTIGIFVLRNTKNAKEVASRMEEYARAYTSKISMVSEKMEGLQAESTTTLVLLEAQNSAHEKDMEVLKAEIKHFEDWAELADKKSEDFLSKVGANLKNAEAIASGLEAELVTLKQKYENYTPYVVEKRPAPTISLFSDIGISDEESDYQEKHPIDSMESNFDEQGFSDEFTAELLLGLSEETFIAVDVIRSPEFDKNIFSVNFPNGDNYKGQFANGFFNGWGLYTYANGDFYEGTFVNDKKSGEGTLSYANGDKYIGEFRDNKQNGRGTLIAKNGRRYVGEFQDGAKFGKGVLRFTNGDIYAGRFSGGTRTGLGVYVHSDGGRYEGYFKNDFRHGKGRYLYSSGDQYFGDFREGKRDGIGVSVYANGQRVKGYWKDDKLLKVIKKKEDKQVLRGDNSLADRNN